MRFSSINDVPIVEMSYKGLVDGLRENIFFKFMETGRQGIVMGVDDAIDNFETFIISAAKLKVELNTEQRLAIRRFGQQEVTDQFIRSGSSGITAALGYIHHAISQGLTENARKTKAK